MVLNMSNIKIIFKYFSLSVLCTLFWVGNEISEVSGGGGFCAETSWCFPWGLIMLFFVSIISIILFIIGIKKVFEYNRTPKSRLVIKSIIIILIVFILLIGWVTSLPGI